MAKAVSDGVAWAYSLRINLKPPDFLYKSHIVWRTRRNEFEAEIGGDE